jgi:Cu(I)/Ag(I) efflux system membrane protein CusA/SilA
MLVRMPSTMIGLLPIMVGDGAGSEVMRRIAGPMIGGMLTAVLLSLMVLPAVFFLYHGRLLPVEE